MTSEEAQVWWSWKVSLESGFWSRHCAAVANLISILYLFIVVSSKVIQIHIYIYLIVKDDTVNCCTHYGSKFGKLSSGYRIGKGPFSFQSQRKAMPKNAQTTAQLHSSHTLATVCSKSSKPNFNST